jgi:predicted HicB family RNase H-like nuclease
MAIASKDFQVRLDAKVHDRIVALARFRGTSINAVVGDLLKREVEQIDGKDAKDHGSSAK